MADLEVKGVLDGPGGQALAQKLLYQQQQPYRMMENLPSLMQSDAINKYREALVKQKENELLQQQEGFKGLQNDPVWGEIAPSVINATKAGVDSSVMNKGIERYFTAQDESKKAKAYSGLLTGLEQYMAQPDAMGNPISPERATALFFRDLSKDPKALEEIAPVLGVKIEDVQKLTDWGTQMATTNQTEITMPYIMDAINTMGSSEDTKGLDAIYSNPALFMRSLLTTVKKEIMEDALQMEKSGALPQGFNAQTYTNYVGMQAQDSLNNLISDTTGKPTKDPLTLFRALGKIANVGAQISYKNAQTQQIPELLDIKQQQADAATTRANRPSSAGYQWLDPSIMQAKFDHQRKLEELKAKNRPIGTKTIQKDKNELTGTSKERELINMKIFPKTNEPQLQDQPPLLTPKQREALLMKFRKGQ